MRKTIQSFFLKTSIFKLLNKKNRFVFKPFRTFSKTKKIGIIFNAYKKENIELIRHFIDYFKTKGVSCEALGFVNQNKMKDFNLASLNIDYFNSKDCNFLGYPNSDNVNNFISEKFDIIINLSDEENIMYDYIVSHSSARFRIGKSNINLYDLVINLKTSQLKEFITEVIFYLDLISKNNESK
tara:strand:- start:1253 stop:1801 length:549 start_codon:yes stop_codon:yes gene_type:complete